MSYLMKIKKINEKLTYIQNKFDKLASLHEMLQS